MPWATPEQTYSLTKRTVTEDDLEAAQAIIEIPAGTTEEASGAGNISTYNLRMLRNAVAYQAVWMLDHPDVFTHIDTDGMAQDGVSYQHAHAWAKLLAPLAYRCVNRLSWNLNPLRVRRRSGFADDRGNRDSAVRDDQFTWNPLQGWP